MLPVDQLVARLDFPRGRAYGMRLAVDKFQEQAKEAAPPLFFKEAANVAKAFNDAGLDLGEVNDLGVAALGHGRNGRRLTTPAARC